MQNTKSNKILVGYIVHVMKFAEICSKYERQASAVFDFALAYSAADFVGASSNKLAALAQANPGCIQLAKEQLAKSSDSVDKDREIKRLRDIYDDAAKEQITLRKENKRLVERLKEVEANVEAACREALENDDQRSVDKSVEVVRLPAKATPKVKKSASTVLVEVKKAPKAEAKADNGQPSVEELRQIFPGVADGLLDWAWTKKCEQDLASSADFSSLEID